MSLNLRKLVLTLGALFLSSSVALGAKYKTINLSNSWSGNEGCTITAGNDTLTHNFNAGTAAACAQELVDRSGENNFTITRVGTRVTICHPNFTPKIEKVGIRDIPVGAVLKDAAFESNLLIAISGRAVGRQLVGVLIEDLMVVIETQAGQTAEEVADALSAELDFVTPPDDPSFAYGVEFNVEDQQNGPIDLGIWSLGTLDLGRAQVASTDPGIRIEIVRP